MVLWVITYFKHLPTEYGGTLFPPKHWFDIQA